MLRRHLLTALPALTVALLAACDTAPIAPTTAAVFFTADSATLDQAARNVVASVAGDARQSSDLPIQVLGFAAPDTGTAEFNRDLARSRAQAVADELVRQGIPRSRVTIGSRGAVAFEMFAMESRRVEIRVGR
jgi:outer membrane protein OmpA-like peptidoglycan-associated protein